MVSNRSIFTCYYQHEDPETDSSIIVHSSQEMQHISAAMSHEIENDVLADNVVTYLEAKPYDGGYELNQVIQLDINGRLPSFIKSKVAKRLAQSGLFMADFVMHGKKPPLLF